MNKQNDVKWLWLPVLIVLAIMLSACGAAETAVANPITQAVNTLTEAAQPETAELAEVDAVVETAVEPAAPLNSVPATAANDPLADLFVQEQAYVSVYEEVNPAVVNIVIGSGQGSGFLFDTNGHIVTNNHVVASGGQIVVNFDDGRQLSATVVGTDPSSDLAVIQVDPNQISDITPVSLADSDALKVG